MKRTDGSQVDEWADRVLRAMFRGETRSAPHAEVVRTLKEALEAGRQEVVDQWKKAREDSKACGLCGGINWFRAGVAFDVAVGMRPEGHVQ